MKGMSNTHMDQEAVQPSWNGRVWFPRAESESWFRHLLGQMIISCIFVLLESEVEHKYGKELMRKKTQRHLTQHLSRFHQPLEGIFQSRPYANDPLSSLEVSTRFPFLQGAQSIHSMTRNLLSQVEAASKISN